MLLVQHDVESSRAACSKRQTGSVNRATLCLRLAILEMNPSSPAESMGNPRYLNISRLIIVCIGRRTLHQINFIYAGEYSNNVSTPQSSRAP